MNSDTQTAVPDPLEMSCAEIQATIKQLPNFDKVFELLHPWAQTFVVMDPDMISLPRDRKSLEDALGIARAISDNVGTKSGLSPFEKRRQDILEDPFFASLSEWHQGAARHGGQRQLQIVERELGKLKKDQEALERHGSSFSLRNEWDLQLEKAHEEHLKKLSGPRHSGLAERRRLRAASQQQKAAPKAEKREGKKNKKKGKG